MGSFLPRRFSTFSISSFKSLYILNHESDEIDDLPTLQGFELTQVGESSFEVSVAKESGLNRLFSALNEAGITVLSMRNKQNRLEQLFIDMVGGKS